PQRTMDRNLASESRLASETADVSQLQDGADIEPRKIESCLCFVLSSQVRLAVRGKFSSLKARLYVVGQFMIISVRIYFDFAKRFSTHVETGQRSMGLHMWIIEGSRTGYRKSQIAGNLQIL